MAQSRELGQTDLSLPAIGLGCMGMSEFYGETDDATSLAVLHRAMELGVEMLDTADMYGDGHNEELLGRFLKETTATPFIATKFGIRRDQSSATAGQYERVIDNSPAYIRQACEASLTRLGVDVIDLYYMHRFIPDFALDEAVGTLARLVEEGKVRYIGLSEVSAATLQRAHAIHPITALQTEYSLQTRDVEEDILPACRALGISFVAYSPLGRGMLTGSITDHNALAPDDFRRLSPRFADNALAANLDAVGTVREIARTREAQPAQIALAWVLQQADNLFAIPGTKQLKYLEMNWGAGEITLTPEEMGLLQGAFRPGAVHGARYPEPGLKIVNT